MPVLIHDMMFDLRKMAIFTSIAPIAPVSPLKIDQ
jgi:hypothetical protein